jgi:hypothetical protein
MAFARAMINNLITTWNGAVSNATPDPSLETDGRVSIFFKATRGLEDDKLYKFMEKSSNENLTDTFILAFYIRDCRGGQGHRDLGRKMLTWLFQNYPEEYNKIFKLIPEYGRYDDLFTVFPNSVNITSEKQLEVQQNVVKYFCEKLHASRLNMVKGEPTDLIGKWTASENDTDDKKYKIVKTICDEMKITPKFYRVNYTSPLRAYLDVVERKMAGNKWEDIDYSKVPSNAMKILKKAFEKHTPERFIEWKNGLESGKTKVNAKQLYPHEIIKEIREKGKADEVVIQQWKNLEEEVIKLGSLKKSLVVVDTSGSMESPNYLPLDMACALGLIISNCIEGEFHNHVITFNNTPEFVLINDGNIKERYTQLRNIPWGGSTDIQKTFDLILEKAQAANLSPEDMPEKIYIISDMQFNTIEGRYDSFTRKENTNFQEIEEKYKQTCYKRPDIVFWNVNGSTDDFPVTVNDDGTILISGPSPSIIKSIVLSESFDTISIMRTTLDSNRYKIIKDLLN